MPIGLDLALVKRVPNQKLRQRSHSLSPRAGSRSASRPGEIHVARLAFSRLSDTAWSK
jgi:hypothetical protein